MNVLIDEFSRCYDAFAAGHAPQLPDLPIQYVDYALWQRRWLEAGELRGSWRTGRRSWAMSSRARTALG